MKLNLMKLKDQTEILKDTTIHYSTKYFEIDQELVTEITTISIYIIGKNYEKEEEKLRKILDKKTT